MWCFRFLNRRPGLTLERQRQDIKDFDPCGLQCISQSCGWVAFGKHLCGAATDFTLRCCVNSVNHPGQPNRAISSSLTEHQAHQQSDGQTRHAQGPTDHQKAAFRGKVSTGSISDRANSKQTAVCSQAPGPADQTVADGLQVQGLQAPADGSGSPGPAGRCAGDGQSMVPSFTNPDRLVTDGENVAASVKSRPHSQASAAQLAEEALLAAPAQQNPEEQLTIPAAASQGTNNTKAPFAVKKAHIGAAAAKFKPGRDQPHGGVQRKVLDAGQETGDRPRNQGLAVATCCHHRCSWNHYVHPEFFLDLGFTPQEFELVSWMAGELDGQWPGWLASCPPSVWWHGAQTYHHTC